MRIGPSATIAPIETADITHTASGGTRPASRATARFTGRRAGPRAQDPWVAPARRSHHTPIGPRRIST